MSYSFSGRKEGLHRETWDFKGCIIGGLGVVVFKASWCSPWLRNWIYRINKRKSNRIALQNKPMKRCVMYTEIEKKVWRHFSWNDLYIHPVLEGLFLIQVWSHQPRQGGHGDLLHGPRLQQRLRSDEAQAQQVHGPWGLQHGLDVRQHHVKKIQWLSILNTCSLLPVFCATCILRNL